MYNASSSAGVLLIPPALNFKTGPELLDDSGTSVSEPSLALTRTVERKEFPQELLSRFAPRISQTILNTRKNPDDPLIRLELKTSLSGNSTTLRTLIDKPLDGGILVYPC
jgi:hypothetical protein